MYINQFEAFVDWYYWYYWRYGVPIQNKPHIRFCTVITQVRTVLNTEKYGFETRNFITIPIYNNANTYMVTLITSISCTRNRWLRWINVRNSTGPLIYFNQLNEGASLIELSCFPAWVSLVIIRRTHSFDLTSYGNNSIQYGNVNKRSTINIKFLLY